jgi:YD repeat-containing protein
MRLLPTFGIMSSFITRALLIGLALGSIETGRAQYSIIDDQDTTLLQAFKKARVKGVAVWYPYGGEEPGVENYINNYRRYDAQGRLSVWFSNESRGYRVHLFDRAGKPAGNHPFKITPGSTTLARCDAHADSALAAIEQKLGPPSPPAGSNAAKEIPERDTLWLVDGDTARSADVVRIFHQGGRDTLRIDYITYKGGHITELDSRYQIKRQGKLVEEGKVDAEQAASDLARENSGAALGMYVALRVGMIPWAKDYLAGRLKGVPMIPDYRITLDDHSRVVLYENLSGLGERITSSYDPKGRLVERRVESEKRTITYTYDKRDLPTTETIAYDKGKTMKVHRLEYSFWK